jgi:tol-pal system protein YbgF
MAKNCPCVVNQPRVVGSRIDESISLYSTVNGQWTLVERFFCVYSLLLFVAVFVSGCATQADIQAVQRERDVLRAQVADNKVAVDSLRREIDQIRGEVEELRHRLERVARERGGISPQVKLLEDRIAVLERQMRMRPMGEEAPPPTVGEPSLPRPEAPGVSPEVARPPSSPAAPVGPASPAARPEETALAREPLEAQDEYRQGVRAMQERQYERAIQHFRTFQRKFPDSPLADDAQYWIGESYFLQRDYNRAILEFNDVLKYRKGDKVPAALLRQAQAFLEIGDRTDARLIYQKLINDHPKSEEAREAQAQLQNLSR